MRELICLVFALMMAGFKCGIAQSVSQNEAIQVAVKLMQSENRVSLTIDSVYCTNTITRNGNALLYEVRFTNGSFVLLSGHKACTPILGMRLAEESGPSSGIIGRSDIIPDALNELLDGYANVIDYCFNNHINEGFYNSWDSVLMCNVDSVVTVCRRVSPLITTKWGQAQSNDNYGRAYNYYVTDSIQYCSPCPAGCVAVAMAQIMKYWNAPYEIPYKCVQYEWNNMPDELIKTNNPNYSIQRNAIARLIKDCGSLVGMEYCAGGHCSSAASTAAVPNALRRLGYHSDDYMPKDAYLGDWEDALRNCLDNNYPVQYRGNVSESSSVGHSFVCCGYKKRFLANGYKYYFNFGWLGEGDGWFVIDNITENQDHILDYFYHQGAIFNIYPNDCWEEILMQCNRSFSENDSKYYSTRNSFSNNNYNYIIERNAEVQIQAGTEILLTHGFYAAEGADFAADITPCGNSRGIKENNTILNNRTENISISNSDEIVQNNLAVFPNPSKASLTVRGENLKQIEIRNMLGQLVFIHQAEGLETTLNISKLPSGLYFVAVISEDGQKAVKKVIKE